MPFPGTGVYSIGHWYLQPAARFREEQAGSLRREPAGRLGRGLLRGRPRGGRNLGLSEHSQLLRNEPAHVAAVRRVSEQVSHRWRDIPGDIARAGVR